MDTNGTEESVLYREVSLFQGLKCMQEWYVVGVGKGVLFREVSSIKGCPYRERGSTVNDKSTLPHTHTHTPTHTRIDHPQHHLYD